MPDRTTNNDPLLTDRMWGVSPEGHAVNNVTDANRLDVNPNDPTIIIHLVSNDLSKVIAAVNIPNTRERPDVVMYRGEPYEVIDTRCTPPVYRVPLVLEATDIPTEENNGTSKS